MEEHLYIVTYDISDQKRWRALYELLRGYGEWLQYSVFQCCLSKRRHAEMVAKLDELIHHTQDHVLIMDFGPAEGVTPRVVSLGKAPFQPVRREAIVV